VEGIVITEVKGSVPNVDTVELPKCVNQVGGLDTELLTRLKASTLRLYFLIVFKSNSYLTNQNP